MPDLSVPMFVASFVVGAGWVIAHAGPAYAEAIRHTLTVFILALSLLVLIGLTAKLRALMGVGRMSHRIEARSQVEPPARAARNH